jgi:hypothetical protein
MTKAKLAEVKGRVAANEPRAAAAATGDGKKKKKKRGKSKSADGEAASGANSAGAIPGLAPVAANTSRSAAQTASITAASKVTSVQQPQGTLDAGPKATDRAQDAQRSATSGGAPQAAEIAATTSTIVSTAVGSETSNFSSVQLQRLKKLTPEQLIQLLSQFQQENAHLRRKVGP